MTGAIGGIGGIGAIGGMGGMGGIGAMGGASGAPSAGAAIGAGINTLATVISVSAPPPGISVTFSDASKAALAADKQLATPINGSSVDLAVDFDIGSLGLNAAGQDVLALNSMDVLVAALLLALLNRHDLEEVLP